MFAFSQTATLHDELRDAAKERSDEAAVALATQRQHDRQVADLGSTVSRLQSRLREKEEMLQHLSTRTSRSLPGMNNGDEVDSDQLLNQELKKQILELSDQIIRQRKKIDNVVSEKSALHRRLQDATARAEIAEKALASSNDAAADSFLDVEHGPQSPVLRIRHMRRRNRGTSIRGAINLPQGHAGDRKESLGKAIDVFDKLTFQTGDNLYFVFCHFVSKSIG